MDTNQTSEVFNWKDFKNGKFYVKVTHENIEDFLSECDKRGLKWHSGVKALDTVSVFERLTLRCGKMYIGHNLDEFYSDLCYVLTKKEAKEDGLRIVKWSDYATEIEDQEEEQEETLQPFTWIPCAERLPEKSGEYLTVVAYEGYMVLPYSARQKAWNSFDDVLSFPVKVVAWAEIPPYKRSEPK